MTNTIINTLRELCNPFNLCDLNAYLPSLKSAEKSLHEMMPESGFGHEAFLIVMSELDAIHACAEYRRDDILVYWDKLKQLLPLFDKMISRPWDYEVWEEMEKVYWT